MRRGLALPIRSEVKGAAISQDRIRPARVYLGMATRNKLIDAPLAVTSTGRVLGGVTHTTGEVADARKALELALASGRRVFVGVALTKEETERAKNMLDDAAAEIVAKTYRERG